MGAIYRKDVGACSFLDVLEEAALRRYRVMLGLVDGTEIEDVVVDVKTEHGADWVVLRRQPRVDATRIAWLARVE